MMSNTNISRQLAAARQHDLLEAAEHARLAAQAETRGGARRDLRVGFARRPAYRPAAIAACPRTTTTASSTR